MEDPYRPQLIECDGLEELATRAEGALILRDDKNGFGTVPLDDIQSNVAAAVDSMDSAGDGGRSIGVIFVAHPDLAAKGTKATRYHSWTFKVAGPPVMCDEPDIGDVSHSIHLPHAAAPFTGHEHVKVKRALMIEGNPGMVPWIGAASVWDLGKQYWGKR